RIGRTARPGATGTPTSSATPESRPQWRLTENREDVRVPVEVLAGSEPVAAPQTEAPARAPDATGGIKGTRPNKKDKLRAAQAAAPSGDQH
ncbi:DEAD/DEAH box helicase, partial [Xanthomonas campestris]